MKNIWLLFFIVKITISQVLKQNKEIPNSSFLEFAQFFSSNDNGKGNKWNQNIEELIMSWDFDFDSPKRKPTATQFIQNPDSSDDDEPTRIGPTQGVWSQDEIPKTPELPSRKRQKISELPQEDPPSPVYESQVSRLSIFQRQESVSGLSQKIDSCSSTQSPPVSRQDSTHISTPTSSDSTLGNSQPEYTSFRSVAKPARRRKPKKNGLVEKLDLAVKRAASNQSLNSHLPSKLRGCADQKKSAEVLEVYKTFSSVTLECLDYKLDPSSGERNVFKIIAAANLQVTKGCDIKIQGPWQTFEDQGTQVYCQVSKISVIQNDKVKKEYELKSEIIYRPNCLCL